MNENRTHKQIFIIFYDILKCYKLWMNRSFRRVLSASAVFRGLTDMRPGIGQTSQELPRRRRGSARDRKRLTDLN